MPQQKKLIVVLSLIIVVLLGVVLYQADFLPSGGNNATSTVVDGAEESVSATSSQAKPAATVKPVTTPKPAGSYISLSYSTPHDAVFVLNTQVKDADIIDGENMNYCVLTTSEVASGASCRDSKVVYGQGFKIKYTEAGNVLQITDVSYLNERKPNMAIGAFKPECTGCSVYIEFSNIRNEQGVILPTKRVLVRAQ